MRRRAVVPRLEPPVVHAGVPCAGLPGEEHPAAGLPFVRGFRIGHVDDARSLGHPRVKRRRLGGRREEQRGQAAVIGAESRRDVGHAVDDAVAGAEAVGAAGDDEEHILGAPLGQGHLLAWRELEAAQADCDGARGVGEVRVPWNIVPMRDQSGSSPSQ